MFVSFVVVMVLNKALLIISVLTVCVSWQRGFCLLLMGHGSKWARFIVLGMYTCGGRVGAICFRLVSVVEEGILMLRPCVCALIVLSGVAFQGRYGGVSVSMCVCVVLCVKRNIHWMDRDGEA